MTAPPGEGFEDKLGESVSKAAAQMERMTDQLGASVAAGEITPGEDIRLEPEMAKAVLDRAQDLLDKLTNIKADADSLKQVTPAAADMVSTGYNKKLTSGGNYAGVMDPMSSGGAFDAGASQLDAAIAYLTAYVGKLNEALGKTHATDQHNGEVLAKAGQSHEQKTGGLAG